MDHEMTVGKFFDVAHLRKQGISGRMAKRIAEGVVAADGCERADWPMPKYVDWIMRDLSNNLWEQSGLGVKAIKTVEYLLKHHGLLEAKQTLWLRVLCTLAKWDADYNQVEIYGAEEDDQGRSTVPAETTAEATVAEKIIPIMQQDGFRADERDGDPLLVLKAEILEVIVRAIISGEIRVSRKIADDMVTQLVVANLYTPPP